ncbi:MAG: hypothetical protein JO129_03515 [Candidatus Dependentiae bacterium]|nr:hypothetical protein [Candidatus Dependentiae bacterium]
MNELICKLSDLESIKIATCDNIDFKKVDFCCSEVKAYFIGEQELCIGLQTTGEFFEPLIRNLKKTIENKLQLHESIIQDLGFMGNEYSHTLPNKNSKFFMVPSPSGESTYWIGSRYQVWETYADTTPHVKTWLYNDYNGNIILEVTPLYTWYMRERKANNLNFITYKNFMKNYKPIIQRTIPRELAIEWLNEVTKIYRGFFKKESNFIQEYNDIFKW